jgi:RNA polymerase sigma-70 factor (ECF subfamily)
MGAALHSVPAGPDEGGLVAQHRQRFEEFFLAEHDRLYRALCLMTGSRDEADEVLQDAFLRLWERFDRMKDVRDPRAYLYRTAMNVFRSRYRSGVRRMRYAMTAREPDDAFSPIEDRDVVIRALQQLTPQQRAAVVLTGLLDHSSEEAGRMLGMKASTVRALSTRAREAMRTKIGEVS